MSSKISRPHVVLSRITRWFYLVLFTLNMAGSWWLRGKQELLLRWIESGKYLVLCRLRDIRAAVDDARGLGRFIRRWNLYGNAPAPRYISSAERLVSRDLSIKQSVAC